MPGSSTLRLVLLLGADGEPECRVEDGPSERLSWASGLARREAARSGWGGPWTWGGVGTFGLDSGGNLEDQLMNQT